MTRPFSYHSFPAPLWFAPLWGLASLLASAPALAQAEVGSPSSTAAAAPKRTTSEDTELLLIDEPVVFTASKMIQRISDSPAAVTVITEEQIRSSGATTIPELLRSVPGVDVMEPNKSQSNVSIRGFNQTFANKVLVMVDGRSINQPILGNVFWNLEPLLLTWIKRIEIVRGPGSVLYGANAFNGVINIITKTPQEMGESEVAGTGSHEHGIKSSGTLVGAYGGQQSTFSEATYSRQKVGDWAFSLGAGYHSTEGFGSQQPGQVHDRARVPIFAADLQKQLSHGSLLLSLNNSDANADLTSEVDYPDLNWHTNSVSLAYQGDQEANPISVHVYGSFFRAAGGSTSLGANTYALEMQQQHRLSARNSLIYGGDYRRDQFYSSSTGPGKYSQKLWGFYLQDQYQLGPATSLFAGIRWDQNSLYGTQISPRLSLIHHLPHNQTVRLSYGNAFRAPTVAEAYVDLTEPIAPGLDLKVVSNTNLKPEKIASAEAGYRLDLRSGYVGLNLFYNRISDIIETTVSQFAPSPPFPPNIPTEAQFQNKGTAQAVGLELEGGFQIKAGWHGLANYAYQDVHYEDGQPTELSPKHKVNLIVESDTRRRWTAYTALHFVSTSLSSPVLLRAYTTVDARIGYRFGRTEQSWSLSLAATNLLDDHHREYYNGLPSAPITTASRRTLWLIIASKI